MKPSLRFPILLFVLTLLLQGSSALAKPLWQISENPLTISISAQQITWQANVDYEAASLSVRGPGDFSQQNSFPAGTAITFSVGNARGSAPDGQYSYTLTFSPRLSAKARSALTAAEDSQDRQQVIESLRQSGELSELPMISGYFQILKGQIVVPGDEEEKKSDQPDTGAAPQVPTDQVINDDLIVTGSFCVGFDCVINENFGFDTIRLKENNTRIFFHDTSTSPFPNTDWQIRANSSSSGGLNAFMIDDCGTGAVSGCNYAPYRTPFVIEADSQNNSIYVDSSGNIGFQTSTPALPLHAVNGNTPGLRLEQPNSQGWGAYTWDIAGNEVNFFIRGVKSGRLPFRIAPEATTNSLVIDSNGRIGLGHNYTSSTRVGDYSLGFLPTEATLHVYRTDGTAGILIEEGSAATEDRTLLELQNQGAAGLALTNQAITSTWTISGDEGLSVINATPVQTTTLMTLDAGGNLVLAGALTEASDAALKENFQGVDGDTLLQKLLSLPIYLWNYRADGPEITHMGPTAQDFYTAFGLGQDERHISPLDVNGVTLASIQALTAQVAAQEAQIQALESENEALEARLAQLEALVNVLVGQQELQNEQP